MFRKVFNQIQNVVNTFTGILLAVMVFIIFCQVIARYGLGHSLSWSEELTRYMFVWLIYLGVSLGIRDNNQFKVDVVDMAVHGKGKKVLDIFHHVMSIIAVIASAYGSFFLIKTGMLATSPSLHLPMYLVYIVFPIGFTFDLIELVYKIYENIRDWNIPEEKGVENA